MSEPNTSLAVRQPTAIAHVEPFDDATKELIRQSVSDPRNPMSNDEFNLFIAVCQHTGLNPLLREIYATRMDGKFTILVGIDGRRRIAQRSPRFRGMAGPFYCGEDGKWVDVWTKPTPPMACRVGIYMPHCAEPTWGVAYMKNYKAKNTPTWRAMAEHMLSIRAEDFALRKCFGRELGGTQLDESDLDSLDVPVSAPQAHVLSEGDTQRSPELMQGAVTGAVPTAATNAAPSDKPASQALIDQAIKVWRAAKEAGLAPTKPNKMSTASTTEWIDYWTRETAAAIENARVAAENAEKLKAAEEARKAAEASHAPVEGTFRPADANSHDDPAATDEEWDDLTSASQAPLLAAPPPASYAGEPVPTHEPAPPPPNHGTPLTPPGGPLITSSQITLAYSEADKLRQMPRDAVTEWAVLDYGVPVEGLSRAQATEFISRIRATP